MEKTGKVDGFDTHKTKNNTSELYDKGDKFQKSYQPWINRLTDDRGNVFVDSHSILSRWKDHLSVNDVTQIEIHVAQPLKPEICAFKVEI
jgi:hypothetical protein